MQRPLMVHTLHHLYQNNPCNYGSYFVENIKKNYWVERIKCLKKIKYNNWDTSIFNAVDLMSKLVEL